MTDEQIRDAFASFALMGVGTWQPNPEEYPAEGVGDLAHPETLKRRAEWAYAQADAMMEARKAALEQMEGNDDG